MHESSLRFQRRWQRYCNEFPHLIYQLRQQHGRLDSLLERQWFATQQQLHWLLLARHALNEDVQRARSFL